MNRTRKEIVLEAWNNAIENGYSEWLKTSEPVDIAVDMMDCDCDVGAAYDLDFNSLVNTITVIQKDWKF